MNRCIDIKNFLGKEGGGELIFPYFIPDYLLHHCMFFLLVWPESFRPRRVFVLDRSAGHLRQKKKKKKKKGK